MIFRHLLRLILLLAEFEQIAPPEVANADWSAELHTITDRISDCCRVVDPTSTDIAIEQAKHAAEVVEGEPPHELAAKLVTESKTDEPSHIFGEGIF
jgi:hypothetical protein